MEIVAEYKGKPTSDLFSEILYTTGNEYKEAMIVVENNNVGFHVLEKLLERGYKNVYHSKKGSHEYVEQYAALGDSSVVPGFTTSLKTRPLIIAKFEEFIFSFKSLELKESLFKSSLTTFSFSESSFLFFLDFSSKGLVIFKFKESLNINKSLEKKSRKSKNNDSLKEKIVSEDLNLSLIHI